MTGSVIDAIVSQQEFKSIKPIPVFKGGAVYASPWWESALKRM